MIASVDVYLKSLKLSSQKNIGEFSVWHARLVLRLQKKLFNKWHGTQALANEEGGSDRWVLRGRILMGFAGC